MTSYDLEPDLLLNPFFNLETTLSAARKTKSPGHL